MAHFCMEPHPCIDPSTSLPGVNTVFTVYENKCRFDLKLVKCSQQACDIDHEQMRLSTCSPTVWYHSMHEKHRNVSQAHAFPHACNR